MAFSNIARTVISIHAPPRGATKEKTYFFTGRGISIHAPPRGATKLRTLFLGFLQHFNSRPSARGDFRSLPRFYALFISIHAPPRGATTWATGVSRFTVFQFTPLREGRRCTTCGHVSSSRFQFTPLREGRLTAEAERNDVETISIHAPPRGATDLLNSINRLRDYFNSRPSARGDVAIVKQTHSGNDFNSRPSARGDRSFE